MSYNGANLLVTAQMDQFRNDTLTLQVLSVNLSSQLQEPSAAHDPRHRHALGCHRSSLLGPGVLTSAVDLSLRVTLAAVLLPDWAPEVGKPTQCNLQCVRRLTYCERLPADPSARHGAVHNLGAGPHPGPDDSADRPHPGDELPLPLQLLEKHRCPILKALGMCRGSRLLRAESAGGHPRTMVSTALLESMCAWLEPIYP